MLAIAILASRDDERIVKAFETHIKTLKRGTLDRIGWIDTYYVDDTNNAARETFLMAHTPLFVVGVCSPSFLAVLIDDPGVWRKVKHATRSAALVVRTCDYYNDPLSPFQGKAPLVPLKDGKGAYGDEVFADATRAMRRIIERMEVA